MGENLKTQDKLKDWECNPNVPQLCSLRDQVTDSHQHLFFECPFSQRVWIAVRGLARREATQPSWCVIINKLKPLARRNNSWNIIGMLLLGACAYFVWHERNMRLFKEGKRSVDQLVKIIHNMVRLKIMTMRFKNSSNKLDVYQSWNIEAT